MEWKPICCIIGAVLINLTLGTFYSIGNMFPYIASYMRNTGNPNITSELGTWITASFLLGQGVFIILGAYIESRFNSRVACIIGCVLHCTSTFLTSWAVSVNFTVLILVYGLGSGLGCGSTYMASIIAAQKWYPQHKGFFTGVIVGGFGLGGLIFTTLQTTYLNPDNIAQDSSGYFNKTIYDKVPSLFIYMGVMFTVIQAVGCLLAFPPPPSATARPAASPDNSTTLIEDDVLPNLKTLGGAFKYRIFYITGLMMMLVAPGVTFVNSLGKRYGQSYIKDDRFLAIVVAVAAVANAMGRLTWGFFMDKFAFSYCLIAKVALFAALILTFPFSFILSSKTLYVVWMLGLFFGFSGTFVLFPLFIEQVFGVKFHGIIYGILYIFLALSSIMTSFLIQITVSPALAGPQSPEDKLVSRLAPCLVIGVLYIACLVLYVALVPVKRLENSIRGRIEMEIAKTRNTLFQRQDLFPLDRGTLAEKTMTAKTAAASGVEKENSLGSIVRFRTTSPEDKKIKRIGKS